MAKPKKRRRMAGRGSVLLIAGLFIGSAGLRISMGANAAWAENDFAREMLAPVVQQVTNTPESGTRAEMAGLLTALQDREAAVAEQEAQLEMRAKSLDVAQQEIERRIQALEAAEQRLSATLALADSAAEDDLARLTTVYENMKPKQAAALFQAMEPEFAAGFLARMKPDSAASIMAGLEPQNAYSISAILAGRNASAPKN
ncbi:hypothetical protein [uncultured Tateyamaria sp.]|uniref:MotE family protein n=1 Tax=Tateyamaria sp. 1078 TaxID=3417464 RepID=UPI00260AFFBA|nr:hypothetical protein [uncultured Tateyamaria sp.]